MRKPMLALAALTTALTATTAQAGPVMLKPSGPWNVDFADEKCRLAGFFGEGNDRHVLFLEQYWPGARFGLTIAGPALRHFRDQQPVTVQFGDGLAPATAKPFAGTVDGVGAAVIFSSLGLEQALSGVQPDAGEPADKDGSDRRRQLDPALGKQVRFVELNQKGRSVRLDTGKLDSTFAVLNQCTAQLLRGWGLDPDQHLTAQSRPRWLNRQDLASRIVERYPTGAAALGEQGIMRLRIIVSPKGTMEDCTVLKATLATKLESPACEVMRDARFQPALDAAGQPFRSLYTTSITYKLD